MSKVIKRFFLTAIIILVLMMLASIPFKHALVFYKGNTEQLEAYLPLEAGDTFQLIWKHSIHLTDVVEKYKVLDNDDIKQYEIVYEHFGIGMPSNALEGETFVYEDGKYHIKDLDNVFPTINLRNGKTVSENRLVWGADDQYIIPLNKYFKPGDWFTLKIEQLSLWDYLKGVEIHE
ncbi:hypothetical protein JOC34_003178 [Virgibacillus halotolerans]|uniref:DUF1850 domain-containing protein n=1 Tax=Virgibacillus halotolerans TaxID=1071053 RepID=UPI00195F9BCF|nr:DUF1850 domain-containing protein [Virgibacillus halotolerans]MBM7600764.1 hypothetical protein [Virgibacillus halotolerans]